MKIIVGAGGTTQDGWVSYEFDNLDIRDRRSWRRHFAPGTLDAVLAEHVLEHLHPAEAEAAARNVYEFLRPGGYWRIAVPDAYNPDPAYHEHSSPDGRYQTYWQWLFGGLPKHQQFFHLDSLVSLLRGVGFRVKPLEWHEANGQPAAYNWNQADGQIYRARGTQHVADMRLLLGFDNTSLIVDAVKDGR